MKRANTINPHKLVPGAWLGVTLTLLLPCGIVSAADAAAAPPPPPPETKAWVTTAAAGLTLTRGNSENFLVTLSLDTKRKWERDEVAFGASGGYGDSTVNDVNTKNTEFLQGYGQYNHLFTERFYLGLRLDVQYDGIAGIEYRVKITPLAGYYLIKNEKMNLAVEAGPAVVFEHLDGEDARTYAAARFAETFDYKLTATTKVWETLAYIPQIDAWTENYLLNFETGIDTAITKKLSLRVVFQDMYASQPAPGKKDNDLRLLAGIAYKF
jgi:putative salt-induced outer membrane protein YdiY